MARSDEFVTLIDNVTGTAVGDSLPTDSPHASYVTMEVVIGGTATVTFQGSVRGNNFLAVEADDLSDSSAPSTTATSSGFFRIDAAGLAAVRPEITAHTSGSVDVYAHAQYQ